MGQMQIIEMADGFGLGAYIAEPASGPVKGAIVVIQEIFGVNDHIREVAEGYAAEGYVAIAPALFDRVGNDIQLGYTEGDMGQGIELAFQKLEMAQTLQDLQSVVTFARQKGSVGVVGYCFGGLLTFLSACQIDGVKAASSYYGGGIAGVLGQQPQCPLILHFGELDAHIPMSDVEKIQRGCPDSPVYVYAADHGFNCDHRGSYNEPAAMLARQRTLEHFAKHL
jgi:carboxymethylenebutenolidase